MVVNARNVMKKLTIVIKRKYFNEILAGTKKEEYRLVKPYWVERLVDKNYTHLIFQSGYSKKAPRLQAEYLGYEVRNIRHDFFGDDEVPVFALRLGAIKQL